MNASCQFHGVGQGLYYDCTIREGPDEDGEDIFRFVYDCGSLYATDKKDLCQQIEKDKSAPKKRLGALFVSHFDTDHVSAIPTLLDAFDVKNVFIPYFSPEELKLFAVLAEGVDERLYELYEDPISYFKNAGCKTLYILHPQESSPGGSQTRYRNYHETNDFALQSETEIRKDTSAQSEMNVVHCYGSADATCLRAEWQFRIYQDQDNETQEAIREEIRGLIPRDQSLKELLKDETLRKKAKEIYENVKYKINQSSLVLYHAPLEERGKAWIEPVCRDGCWCCCRCLRRYGGGTLLTGDIGLTRLQNRGANLEKFVEGCEQAIGVFLLPHHGARGATSINQLEKMLGPEYPLFVCSYGRENHFGHPDAYMLDQIMMQLHRRVIHVTKGEGFQYEVFVRPKEEHTR